MKAVSDTVWICLKAMITEKTLKEESSHKNYYDDNYRAPFAMLALSLLIYLLVAIHRCKSSGRHPLPQGYKYAGYTEGLMY